MRILLVWLLSLTTSIVVSAQQNAGTHSGRAVAETEIVGVQDALIAAYIDRDTAALDRILANEYTFINDDAGGVVSKKQILDSFRSGGIERLPRTHGKTITCAGTEMLLC